MRPNDHAVSLGSVAFTAIAEGRQTFVLVNGDVNPGDLLELFEHVGGEPTGNAYRFAAGSVIEIERPNGSLWAVSIQTVIGYTHAGVPNSPTRAKA